jgi:hypothetical protein
LTYPPAVVERINTILLGFIQAHDGHRQSDEDVEARLYSARKALFNIPAPSGNRFIDNWDTLLKIAGQHIADRGEPQISNDWELYWDPEPSNVRTFSALVRLHATEGLGENQLKSLIRRFRRNFNKHKSELLRQAHFTPSSFIRPDDAIVAPLADWLDEFGIRLGMPRNLKLGHKPKPIK